MPTEMSVYLCIIELGLHLIFVEELAFGHRGRFGKAAVVAFAAATFAGEHGLGAFLVLLKLHMLIDGKGLGHRLDIKVVGADERESPVLLLQFLYHGAYHFQGPFLATVLFAIGDDGHQYMIAILNLGIDF